MAERRAIASNLYDNEFFGEVLDFMGQALWIGLIVKMADDQGRMEDKPAFISSKIWPYKQIPADEINETLDLMADHGWLLRYEVGGKHYIQLLAWWDNQPLQYATPSNYHPPEGWRDRYRTIYKGHKVTFNWPGQEDTDDGKALWAMLSNGTRVPSWTSYLGTLPRTPRQEPQVDALNPNLNLNPLNTIGAGAPTPPGAAPENPTEKPAKAPKAKREPTAMDLLAQDLQKEFLILTGLATPKTNTENRIKEWQKLWRAPLGEIAELGGTTVDGGKRLIDEAVKQMRKDHLTISDPNSIIKVARSIAAEEKAPYKPDTFKPSEVYR